MVATTEVRRDVIDPAEIGLLTNEVIPLQLVREVEPVLREIVADFGNDMLGTVGLQATFDVIDARVIGFLTEFGATKVQGINATTRRQLSLKLAEGVLAGEGEEALARRVRGVFRTASVTRSKLIARTEVNAAANFARNLAMNEAADQLEGRRWIATLDPRTRRNHRALHNQVQPVGVPFRIPGTGKTAMHPGGFADVGENANCRCVIVPVVSKVRGDVDRPTIPLESDRDTVQAFDSRVARWERVLERALRRAFLAQERAVLRVLAARDRVAI